MGRKRKDAGPAFADSAPPSGATADLSELALPAEALTQAAPPPPPTTHWRVGETRRVALFGHLTTLTKGDHVSVFEYGPEGIARLLEQGVALEPV